PKGKDEQESPHFSSFRDPLLRRLPRPALLPACPSVASTGGGRARTHQPEASSVQQRERRVKWWPPDMAERASWQRSRRRLASESPGEVRRKRQSGRLKFDRRAAATRAPAFRAEPCTPLVLAWRPQQLHLVDAE